MIIVVPLTFLSNAFVPIDTLPRWLKWFVNINPVTLFIKAVRQLLDKGTIGKDFWMTLIGSIVIVAVFAPLTVRAYKNKA
jgi:ABC-2 type transport system permease protein